MVRSAGELGSGWKAIGYTVIGVFLAGVVTAAFFVGTGDVSPLVLLAASGAIGTLFALAPSSSRPC